MAANSNDDDYKLSIDEMCNFYDALSVALDLHFEELGLNCSQTVLWLDRNNDTLLNGYEAMNGLFLQIYFQEDTYKASQLNCSKCAPSISIYYS